MDKALTALGFIKLFLPNSCYPSTSASPEHCRTDFLVNTTNRRCFWAQNELWKRWALKCLFNVVSLFYMQKNVLLLLEIQHEWELIYAEVHEQLWVSVFQKSDRKTLQWTLLSGHAAGKVDFLHQVYFGNQSSQITSFYGKLRISWNKMISILYNMPT